MNATLPEPADPSAVTATAAPAPSAGRRRRWWLWVLAPVAGLAGLVAAGSAYFTVDFETDRTVADAGEAPVPEAPDGGAAAEEALAWPEARLEGLPAKRLLLKALLQAGELLNKVPGYTATFARRERINGTLGEPQTMTMKVRHRPFAVYLRFLDTEPGKEVIYAEGHYDNHVIAHPGGWKRHLLPRLAVPPDHPLALAGNRHPIVEAGLANLVKTLIRFRRMDLEDEDAVTILDRITDDQGRERLRSIHIHTRRGPERPFAYIEVHYDPDTFIPVRIDSYDWPEEGKVGPQRLAESYAYEGLDLDAELTDQDFDPANPSYEFQRF